MSQVPGTGPNTVSRVVYSEVVNFPWVNYPALCDGNLGVKLRSTSEDKNGKRASSSGLFSMVCCLRVKRITRARRCWGW